MRRAAIVVPILVAVCAAGAIYLVVGRAGHSDGSHFRLTIQEVRDSEFRLDVRRASGDPRLRIRVTTADVVVKTGSGNERRGCVSIVRTDGPKSDKDGYAESWSQTYRVANSGLSAGRYTVSAHVEATEKGPSASEGGCPICGFTLKTAKPATLVVK